MVESRLGTFLTTQEIADAISKSRKCVVDAINAKADEEPLRAIKVNGKWFIAQEDAQEFIKRHQEKKSCFSPSSLAKAIGKSRQYVMDSITGYGGKREPTLRATKQGQHWLISETDAQEFIQRHIEKQTGDEISAPLNLGEWLESRFTKEWKPVEKLLGSKAGLMSFRGLGPYVTRAKKVRLGKTSIVLVVSVFNEENSSKKLIGSGQTTVSIRLQVCASGSELNLPDGLRLLVVLDSGESNQVQAGTGDQIDRWIQLLLENFSSGEEFAAIITHGKTTLTERFVV